METCPLIAIQKIFAQFGWTVMRKRFFMEHTYNIALQRGLFIARERFMKYAARYWADHHIREYF